MSDYSTIKKKLDNVWVGAIIGLFSPLITLYIFYLFKYSRQISFSEYYNEILIGQGILTPTIKLCAISNLLVFFIFIWTNRNYNARGVLLATIVYAGFVVYQYYIK